MESKCLAAFLAIADELHFGRAAAKLGLPQPSLSQQLQRLERQMGVQLVSRTSRDVRLTPSGHAFRVEAQRLVDQMDGALRRVRDAAADQFDSVNVGFNGRAAQHVLPCAMARMQADHPDVRIQLWAGRSGRQLDALARGDIDVGLLYCGPTTGALRSKRLLTVSLAALVGERHDWAGRSAVPVSELAHQPCLLFSREQSPAMYDALVTASMLAGAGLNVVDHIDDTAATEITVIAKSVVGFASITNTQDIRPMGLKAVPLVDPVPTVDLHVAWRATKMNYAVRAFLDTVNSWDTTASPPKHPHWEMTG